MRHSTALELPAMATPARAPVSGHFLAYFKADGLLYRKNAAGVESLVNPSTGSGPVADADLPARLRVRGGPQVTDCNAGAALDSGWWYAENSAANGTGQYVVGFTVEYSANAAGFRSQQAWSVLTPETWVRYQNNGVWSVWQRTDVAYLATVLPVDGAVTFPKLASAAVAASGESSASKVVRADDARLASAAAVDHAHRYCTTGQSIGNNAAATVLWNVADSLDGGITYNATTGAFTVARKGRYMLTGSLIFTANATGVRSIRFLVSGATDRLVNSAPVSGQLASAFVSHPMKLVAGDTVTAQAYQNSGGALTLITTQAANFVTISYMGPSA